MSNLNFGPILDKINMSLEQMKFTILFILIFKTFYCAAQLTQTETTQVETEIRSENIFDLSIVKIYPDSFPQVSVIFQAKNHFGQPLWKLDKSEIEVTENDQHCEVLRLLNISKDKPINIGLVFDHSGSMVDNPPQMPDGLETMQEHYFYGLPMPKDYVMAIDYAKEGVLGFLEESKSASDSVLFVGFSSTVDKIYPLTNDLSGMKTFVEKVSPEGRTAFYDALFLSLENLAKSSSKSVIVALTDGQDNSSKYTAQDVIKLANEKEIAIYTIGLGDVNTSLLGQVSEQTDGFYYYTNDPKKLKEIYLNIKEQIRSIYQVDYRSNNESFIDSERNIQFSFVNDTLEFADNSTFFSLPEETISYLMKKEEDRIRAERNNLIFGGLGILILGFGSFIIFRRKRVAVTKAYPNPFQNEITVEYKIAKDQTKPILKVLDANGNVVHEINEPSSHGREKLNLEHLERGVYLIQLSSDVKASKPIKVIKK